MQARRTSEHLSLYFSETPYSMSSAPSTASLIASMTLPFIRSRSNHTRYPLAFSSSTISFTIS